MVPLPESVTGQPSRNDMPKNSKIFHMNTLWAFLRCLVRLFFWAQALSHRWHLYGFSPVWILMCVFNTDSDCTIFRQTGQDWCMNTGSDRVPGGPLGGIPLHALPLKPPWVTSNSIADDGSASVDLSWK